MTTHISILRIPGFPSADLPEGLTPEWIGEALAPACSVRYISLAALKAGLVPGKSDLGPGGGTDLLILPYGNAFPVEGLDGLRRFVGWGGNVMTTGGLGFGRLLQAAGDGWAPVAGDDPCREALATLGFKYYQPSVAPSRCQADTGFLPELPDSWAAADPGACLTVNTGDGRHYSRPPAGNVFPERYPVREGIPLVSGTDRFGQVLKHGVHLVKDWQSHGRWLLVCMAGEAHILDPRQPRTPALLRRLVALATHSLTLHRLETDLPCYRDGEPVRISCRIRNRHGRPVAATLNLTLLQAGRVVQAWQRELRVAEAACEQVTQEWSGPFDGDDYTVQASLEADGAVVDRAGTGFLHWNPVLAQRGWCPEPGGRYFKGTGEAVALLHGMNYYESKIGELMWLRPDPAKIDADLAQMRSLGINMLRPHYHHSKWFRDYSRRFLSDRMLPFDDYFSVCAEGPQPEERDWRVLDMFVQLCHKHGIVFHPDIFSLVPEEMGDSCGWNCRASNDAVTTDPARMAEQDRFIAAIAKRYRDWPGIFWDLWNESEANHPRMKDWTAERVSAFRAAGDRHPVLLGSFTDRLDMPRSLAALSMHGDIVLPVRNLLPFFAHEVWNSQGCSTWHEDRQRRKMLSLQHGSFAGGACGFQPWSWTRQARLRNDMCPGERWDDELGIGTRDDGVLKPSGRALADGIRLFDRLGLVEAEHEDVLVVQPRRKWDLLYNMLPALTGLFQRPLAIEYPDLAEGLAFQPRLVCLIEPPADLADAERERLRDFVRAGGILYQSGGAPLLPGKPDASEPALALADGARVVTDWEWASAGDIPQDKIGQTVRVEDLCDSETTFWNPCRQGERWGLAIGALNAGIRPGAHYLLRAAVDVPAGSDVLSLENPIGSLWYRHACGDAGMPENNLWIYADGRLVAGVYGWEESRILPCRLAPGRHELLLVVQDLRAHGGVVGTIALGAAGEGFASATWKLGAGQYIHAPMLPESRDRRSLPALYRRLLDAAGFDLPDADRGDSELFRLPTTRGTAWVAVRATIPGFNADPGQVRIGPWQAEIAEGGILHLVDGQPVLVEALRLSDAAGILIEGVGGTALVDSADGLPITKSSLLRVKLREGSGQLILRHEGHLRAGRLLADDGQELAPAEVAQADGVVTLCLDPEAANYWTELEFERNTL
jgi:hypothetical protein